MPRDNYLTSAAALIAGIPFRLRPRPPFQPPRKILILKPCCLSQVMLATPLLAALSDAYPKAQIDWAISDWARPAVAANPRVSELIDAGRVGLAGSHWRDVQALVARLRQEQYDTCFIPSRSSLLAYVAWRAGIRQRIGLNVAGRGFAHTIAVNPNGDAHHEAGVYLSLAAAAGIASTPFMEFYPRDADRAAITARLVEEVDWLGDKPLALLHPGGGHNPVRSEPAKQWPIERFARLGSYLARQHGAQVLLLGSQAERERAQAVLGLMSAPAVNLAGSLTLGELGALSEMADLYVGNDAGPTHIAAAVGCPTLAIFGPTAPPVSQPFVPAARLATIACPLQEDFSWEGCATLEEAIQAADRLLALRRTGQSLAGGENN